MAGGTINVTAVDPTAIDVVTIQLPGAPGPVGPQGVPGPSNVLTIGTVSTLAAGASATATISGVSPNQVLNIGIPQGLKGDKGDPNTLTIGTTTTVPFPQSASATITGTAPNQVLNLTLPAGPGLLGGGLTGDVLVKNTGSDYDTTWTTPTGTGSLTRQSYVDTGDSNTLTSANSHADTGDTNTLASAKSYADTQDATNLASAKSYADTQDTANLTTAKNYADFQDAALGASAATASKLIRRDTNGRAQVAEPSVSADIATKNYVDTTVGTGTAGATAATPNTLLKRDASGRGSVADPSASTDIATKNYVDNTAGDAANTANTLVRRSSGQAIAASILFGLSDNPTSGDWAANKNYVDSKSIAPTNLAIGATQFVNYGSPFQVLRTWGQGNTGFLIGFIKTTTSVTSSDYLIGSAAIPAALRPTAGKSSSYVIVGSGYMRVDVNTNGDVVFSVPTTLASGAFIAVNMSWPLI